MNVMLSISSTWYPGIPYQFLQLMCVALLYCSAAGAGFRLVLPESMNGFNFLKDRRPRGEVHMRILKCGIKCGNKRSGTCAILNKAPPSNNTSARAVQHCNDDSSCGEDCFRRDVTNDNERPLR